MSFLELGITGDRALAAQQGIANLFGINLALE